MEGTTLLFSNGGASIWFDGASEVGITFVDGHCKREEFDALKEAVRCMYEETQRAGRTIVLRLDGTALQEGVHVQYVLEWMEMFKVMRPVSEAILERTVVVLRTGIIATLVRKFLATYPVARPIEIQERP